ncbi:MAG TPA: porin family protein [Methylocystis sp.]|nr:porin family protein [Methylocystis sp.]HXZ17375.1 porin family protein [Roseiarcus sp.]
MTKLAVAVGVAGALIAGAAMGADLPYRKEALPAPPPPPAFTWTGLYGGINIGYGFGNGDQDTGGLVGNFTHVSPSGAGLAGWSLTNNIQGVLGGGQVGYNYQINPWLVVGLEADIQAADLHTQTQGASATGPAPASVYLTQTKSVDWFGTLRGRIGVTPLIPNLLIFGSIGFAYGQVVHDFTVTAFGAPTGFPAVLGTGTVYDATNTGWTAGGGVEWFPLISHPVLSTFSVKVEYLYTDLGPNSINGGSYWATAPGSLFAFDHTSQTRFHTVRAGLNWHFNPFAPAPVVAKY